jgi:hypothetical protein
MSISDDEIRKTLQVLLSDKSKLLVLSQLIDANLAERKKLLTSKRDYSQNLVLLSGN